MKIYFTNVKIGNRLLLRKTLNYAARYLNQPSNKLELSLSIVSQEEIKQLNKQYRGVDTVTDVLSFPIIDNPKRQTLDYDSFSLDVINPQTGNLNLGDIVICLDRAIEQAENYGHSLKRELSFLALHGLLHLFGYDHMADEDEKQMFTLQEYILSKLNITR